MSKEREASGSRCSKKHTNEEEDSDPFEQGSNAKRVKLDPLSDTTLQDLPMELHECILVKAVVMEVKERCLVKNHWKENAEAIVSRLKAVNSHWSNILSTNSFRTKLHRTLDKETIHLEMLDQLAIDTRVTHITTMNDEIFVLDTQVINVKKCMIKVFDRNNMAKVKDVIPLPQTASSISACHVSNCVYVSLDVKQSLSILRIAKVAEHQFDISPFMADQKLAISPLYVQGNGNILLFSMHNARERAAICVYTASGILQRKITLPPDIHAAYYTKLLQKSNMNVVLSYVCAYDYFVYLVEMDTNGSIVRQYQSTANYRSYVNFADGSDTLMIVSEYIGIELLDSDFNHMGTFVPPHFEDGNLSHYSFHYDSERNEIVNIYYDRNRRPKSKTNVLTRFRFA